MSTSYCRTGEKKSHFGIYERKPFAYNGRIPNDSRTTKTIYRKNMEKEIIREIDVQNVMTKSSLPVGGFSVNPYVGCPHACKYCYASFMKRFTGHTEPWGTFLDVKHWKPIDNPHKYDGQRIVIGSVTDGYHPYEEDFCRTRKLLEELKGTNAEIMICTKSDLVLRDIDLLKGFQKVTVSWSVNTLYIFIFRLGLTVLIFSRVQLFISIFYSIAVALSLMSMKSNQKLFYVFIIYALAVFSNVNQMRSVYMVPYTNYFFYLDENLSFEERSNYNFIHSPYKEIDK